jgi:hypothetical protein
MSRKNGTILAGGARVAGQNKAMGSFLACDLQPRVFLDLGGHPKYFLLEAPLSHKGHLIALLCPGGHDFKVRSNLHPSCHFCGPGDDPCQVLGGCVKQYGPATLEVIILTSTSHLHPSCPYCVPRDHPCKVWGGCLDAIFREAQSYGVGHNPGGHDLSLRSDLHPPDITTVVHVVMWRKKSTLRSRIHNCSIPRSLARSPLTLSLRSRALALHLSIWSGKMLLSSIKIKML